MKQFRMAMQNLRMLCEIQKDSSCKTNLEHFLESIIYILYIFSKLGKSEVQRLKRCANRSWNEEVMAIWRQLHRVENEFRNSQSQMWKFRTNQIQIRNFHTSQIQMWNFHNSFSTYEIFVTPFPLAKFLQHHQPLAIFSQLHIWLAKSSCNLQIFCTDSVRFLL